ncbi:hypothetical protein Tco_0162168 [Tanacetum coccineum]
MPRRASLVSTTECLNSSGFTSWKDGLWYQMGLLKQESKRFLGWNLARFGSTGFYKNIAEEKMANSQSRQICVYDILKKFGFSSVKTTSTPRETHKPLSQDTTGTDVDVHLYRSMIGSLMYLTSYRLDIMFADLPMDLITYYDTDYDGASIDKKSTTGEYIAASKCYGLVLWLQNQLLDYGYNFMKIKIHVDNESAILAVKNHVYHSKTKHIEIRHHFIRDSYEKKLIEMVKIHRDYNVADLHTKAFNVTRFQFLIASIEEDSSKQGRSLIEELDMDVDISLVPPHDAEIREKISDDTEVSTATESLVYIRRSAKKKKDKGKAIMIEDESVQKKSKKQVQEERKKEVISKVDMSKSPLIGYVLLLYRDQIHSFVPMESEKEVQRLKRAGQDIEAEPAKRQRTKEVSESVQEQTDELSQEQLNQMVIIVLDEGINVEALQTKYPIIG